MKLFIDQEPQHQNFLFIRYEDKKIIKMFEGGGMKHFMLMGHFTIR